MNRGEASRPNEFDGNAMSDTEKTPIENDDQYHHYRGNVIPWWVRLMWLGFWIFAIAYTIRFLFPALRVELFQP